MTNSKKTKRYQFWINLFPGKNKLLCISVYYQTGRENTPCVWRYNSYYSSRYLFKSDVFSITGISAVCEDIAL